MKQKPRTDNLKVRDIKRLLKRYDCPLTYQAVRARFLGCIASPLIDTHPLRALAALWGGEMPECESIEDANELMQGLVNGVWNPLTILLSDNKSFRLARLRAPSNSKGLTRFARIRIDEIDGFIDGLLDGEESVELPQEAIAAIEALVDLATLFEAFIQFAGEPGSETGVERAIREAPELSFIAEQEINEVVLACTKARHAALAGLDHGRPTLH